MFIKPRMIPLKDFRVRVEAAMGNDEVRKAIAQWRSLAACPLLAAVLACQAKCAMAEDSNATPVWHYRDYQLYNAPPTVGGPNHIPTITQVNVGELLKSRDIEPSGTARHLLLSAGFDNRADWESIRYGLGVFSPLPDSGQFHFNLYVRPNAQRPGYRWQLQPTGLPIVTSAGHQSWSIGGFVDYGHGQEGPRERIGVAPQLLLNLNQLLHMPGDAQASLQYAYWRSVADSDTAQGRALQMALRWRF